MADLILKPNSAIGDKLILQDRDGGAVLTTADSGISSIKFTSGSAPGSPAKGAIYYDNSESTLKHYDGTKWVPLAAAAKATGGSTYTYSTYTVHAFTTSGTFTVTSGTLACDVLVVAGGGGGGGGSGTGGGGAGGILYNSASNSTIGNAAVSLSGSYTVTIGRGGLRGDGYDEMKGGSGGNSVFTNGTLTYTAVGGGGGGGTDGSNQTGNAGGSGGGGRYNAAGGAGTSGQGYAGAHGKQGHTVTGGGGGGAAGTPAQPAGNQSGRGDGGAGIDYSSKFGTMYGATSTNVDGAPNGWFGGGGGSGSETARPGYGGNGGGGEGSISAQMPAYNGYPHSGGGGGGAYHEPAFAGSGGSGIVLIRYST